MKKDFKNILLVEDDPNFGTILKDRLSHNDYNVVLARNGIEGLEKFKKGEFDICLLDIMMPYKDGFTLSKQIRSVDQNVPILFLTAKTLKEDVLKGFKVGADDYLTKPFDTDILLAKIKAISKRQISKDSYITDIYEYKIGKYHFNTKLRELSFENENPVKLSPKGNKLLHFLVIKRNDILPRNVALNKIWGDDNYFTARSMDVYIVQIRKFLNKDPNIQIANIHGEGFRLVIKEK